MHRCHGVALEVDQSAPMNMTCKAPLPSGLARPPAGATYRDRIRTVAVIAVLPSLALLAYYPLLGYAMSSGDTWPLLIGSRITDLHSLVELFTTRLLDHTNFGGDFYRPVARLSYAIDQRLHGLEPAGFYATNILIHALSGLLTYYCARRLALRRTTALVAAVLFVLHPLAIEAVPTIARRQDLLACLFSLGCIGAALRWRQHGGAAWLAVSAFAFGCGLASKEIAIFAPLVVLAWLLLEPGGGRPLLRLRTAAIVGASLTVALVLYLVARGLVIAGVGGYAERGFDWGFEPLVATYVNQLLIPQGWSRLHGGDTGLRIVMAAGLLGFVALLVANGAGRDAWRRRLLLLIWMLAPLMVCLATSTFSYRSIYSGIPPAAMLLADAVLWRGATGSRVVSSLRHGLRVPALMLVIGLLVFSPLFHRYDEWRTNSAAQADAFAVVGRALAEAPGVTALDVSGLPNLRHYYGGREPSVRSVSNYHRYVLAAWLADHVRPVRIVGMRFEHRRPDDLASRVVSAQDLAGTLVLRLGPSRTALGPVDDGPPPDRDVLSAATP